MDDARSRSVRFGAFLLVVALACTAAAQDNAAAEAWKRLQLSSDQLVALYWEAAAIHNGLVYSIDVARYDDCSAAEQLASDLTAPRYRLKPLRQITQTSRFTNRYLFAMEPELREQIRSMIKGERTGVVKLASGTCLVAEMIETQQKPMVEAKELAPVLPLAVERGWLPHPDLLAQDPNLRNRTIANKIHSLANVEAAPADFDINTRRSDGHTVLTHALLVGNGDFVRAVLARGANPNACGPMSCPIELALRLRDRELGRDLLDRLLKAGADPNQVDRAQRTRLLPLAVAATIDLGFVERLVDAGAKVNGFPDFSPPTFFAAAGGRQDMVDYLVAHGADVFAQDTSRLGPRSTLYSAAQESKNPVFVDWIEKRIVEAAAKSGQYKCEVWLEQDGRRVVPAAGTYHLKRAPFRIVVRLAEPSVRGLVLASAETRAFQQDVQAGAPESVVFHSATAVAEEGNGTSDWLDVLPTGSSTAKGGTQYWFWTNDTDRRFTGRRGTGHAIEYYKDIRAIALDSGVGGQEFKPIPIDAYSGSEIYVVAAVPVPLSMFDQRFVDPTLLTLTFIDSTRRASR